MSISDLYQQTILEHSKNPRNKGILEPHSHSAHGKNPLCGDQLYITMNCKDGVIEEIAFAGDGCAISKASASLMTSAVKGKHVEDAKVLLQKFSTLLTTEGHPDGLGKLTVFSGVRAYPSRVKCAMLCWRTLESSLEQGGDISTE